VARVDVLSQLDRLVLGEVVVVDEFLSGPCLDMIVGELEFAYWWPTEITWRLASGSLRRGVSLGRRSESTSEEWFSVELRREIALLEERICRPLGISRRHLERWQAARYEPGGYFDAHLDGGLFGEDPAGERAVTLLLYLNTPADGGSTAFPELGLEVDACAGRLVAWPNLLPDGSLNPRMMHGAQRVEEGHKMILTTWVRQHPVREARDGC
jgi:prolyl 4-hydroxylase